LTLRLDGNLSRDQILRATLDGVAKRGFHLIHPALYGELLGFTTQDTGTVPGVRLFATFTADQHAEIGVFDLHRSQRVVDPFGL